MYIKLKYISQDILFISPVTLTLLRRESSSWTLSSGNIICITLVKKNLQISFLNYFDTRTVKKQNKKNIFFFLSIALRVIFPQVTEISESMDWWLKNAVCVVELNSKCLFACTIPLCNCMVLITIYSII